MTPKIRHKLEPITEAIGQAESRGQQDLAQLLLFAKQASLGQQILSVSVEGSSMTAILRDRK